MTFGPSNAGYKTIAFSPIRLTFLFHYTLCLYKEDPRYWSRMFVKTWLISTAIPALPQPWQAEVTNVVCSIKDKLLDETCLCTAYLCNLWICIIKVRLEGPGINMIK